MISYQDARNKIQECGAAALLGNEMVATAEIAGRVCAAPVYAEIPNQNFDNSAMDGFALNSAELENAAADRPVILTVAGHIAAGESLSFAAPERGQCYEIMTGAPLPPGCDAVVPVEKTAKNEQGKIVFTVAAKPGDNIRRIGEDYQQGDLVISPGAMLQAPHILALATLGVTQVSVVRRPRVALLSTGREIVEPGTVPLQHGQIYNSTQPYLRAAMAAMGMDVRAVETLPDDPSLFRERLSASIENGMDLCVSTGAVSAGVHDFVPSVLKELGAEIFFHKSAIRPGKPIFFARLPGHGPFYIGLPGNPASSAAGLRFFVAPLLRALQGLPAEEPSFGILKGTYRKGDAKLRFFMRAQISHNAEGLCEVDIPQKQPSFMVGLFTRTNGWASIPEEANLLEAGTRVAVYPDF